MQFDAGCATATPTLMFLQRLSKLFATSIVFAHERAHVRVVVPTRSQ